MTINSNDRINLFTKDLVVLMVLRITRPAIDLFGASFLIAYLLEMAQKDIRPIALYCGFYAAAISVTFFMFGNFAKQKNKVVLLRLGILLSFLHLLAIAYLKHKSVQYIIPLGISYGFHTGLYCCCWSNIISEKISVSLMGKFMGYMASLSGITKISSSYLFGKYISISSFEACLSIILLLSCIELAASFFINSSQTNAEKFTPLKLYRNIKHSVLLKKAMFIEIIKGMTCYGCLTIIVTICTVDKYGSNADFGIFNSIFAFLTIAISFIFGRFITRKHYPALSVINSFFIIMTNVLFSIYDTKLNFILYNLCYAAFVQLIQLVSDVNMFSISGGDKVKNNYKVEYFAIREAYLNLGRIIGYSLMFIAGTIDSPHSLKYLMIFLTLGISYVGFLSNELQHNMDREEEDLKAYAAAE